MSARQLKEEIDQVVTALTTQRAEAK
jgi:hypothetical protein